MSAVFALRHLVLIGPCAFAAATPAMITLRWQLAKSIIGSSIVGLRSYGVRAGSRPTAGTDQDAGQVFLRSRWPYIAVIGFGASAALAYSTLREPTVTQRVYLDFEVDGAPVGRVVVGLYGKDAPKTCENFAALVLRPSSRSSKTPTVICILASHLPSPLTTSLAASHDRGFGYRGCPVHRIMRGWSLWTGDVTRGDGTGGVSVFGPSFGVETMGVRHRRGSVSMVLDEEGRLRSQFFFTLVTTPALDRKAAAFGRVLEGLDVLDRLSRLPTRFDEGDGQLRADVRVLDSGVLPADAIEGKA